MSSRARLPFMGPRLRIGRDAEAVGRTTGGSSTVTVTSVPSGISMGSSNSRLPPWHIAWTVFVIALSELDGVPCVDAPQAVERPCDDACTCAPCLPRGPSLPYRYLELHASGAQQTREHRPEPRALDDEV